MPEEYFDIVDENNIPTGQTALRSEAHTLGLWHRAVPVYLFRRGPKNVIEFLIHLRSASKDLFPNHWHTRFGGHVKAGESIEETAVHELQEEIGLDISHEFLLRGEVRKSERPPNNEFQYPFYLEFEHEEGLVFNDGEVQRVEWMNAEDIIGSMQTRERPWAATIEGFRQAYKNLTDQL